MATSEDRIVPINLDEEMKTSYLLYSMSVIVARALPDVRDGLKPVQRRILRAMDDLNLRGPHYRKSAKIAGDTSGNYHPHGEAVIYPTIVRMVQTFNARYPLVEGQGNFGSIDGDSPAQMRYCLTGDSLVLTDRGLVRIDRLAEQSRRDGAEEAEEGTVPISTRVLSMGGRVNTASKWFDCGPFPTRRVRTRHGFEVTGSLNHPLLVCVPGEEKRVSFVWKRIDQIQEGDWLVIDRSEGFWPEQPVDLRPYHPELADGSRTVRHELPTHLTEDVALLMGALLAEGTFRSAAVEFTNTEGEFADTFTRTWQQVFPSCRLHTFLREPFGYGKKPFWQMQVVALQVVAFLKSLGLNGRSADREIPEAILQSPKAVVAAFLRGLYEGNGAVEHSGREMLRVGLWAKNRRMLLQVQALLLRFGIIATLNEDEGRDLRRLLIIGHENNQRFADRIGFVSAVKQNALTEALKERSGRALSRTDFVPFLADYVREHATRHRKWLDKHNFDRPTRLLEALPRLQEALPSESFEHFEELVRAHYLYEQVVAVEDAGEQPVYSVRVDSECHSFVANGFVNHNTEVRMSPLALEMLADIDKNTVDFIPNYDQTREEPVVLPARFPNLLANGCSGIAVGMATNIPPHNLSELVDAITLWIDNPHATVDELMEKLPGPDFPTHGLILGTKGIRDAYATGRGAVTMQAKTQIEPMDGGKHAIVITELPYQVNKKKLIEQIAELVKQKKIEGITDLQDYTDKHGMRVVVELKRDAHPQRVLNYLLKHTPLRTNFGVLMLALVDGAPRVLTLSQVIQYFVKHRQEVVRRRTEFDLELAKRRAHIVEGLLKAIDVIDEIIRIIRASRTVEIARRDLMETFAFSELQTQAILEMQLQRLVNLERQKLQDEYRELIQKIAYLEGVLADVSKVLGIIKEELKELKRKFGDARRTRIVPIEADQIGEEDTIPEEETIVTITRNGYIKRVAADTYRVQKRGGRGVIAATSKEEDEIAHLFVATTHHYILFFTDRGRVYRVKAYEVPQGSRQAMGTAVINLISIEPGEAITATVPLRALDQKGFLVMGTERGEVKRSNLAEFQNLRANGLRAFDLEENDRLRWVHFTDGTRQIIMATAEGQAIRFPESELRAAGRGSGGVRGMTLDGNDRVIGMEIVRPEADLLVVAENGYGKRTPLKEYPTHHRGGKGLLTMRVTQKTGKVADIKVVDPDDRLLIMTAGGIVIRTRIEEIRRIGRATEGVRLINVGEDDRVASIERVALKPEGEASDGAAAQRADTAGAQPGLDLDAEDDASEE